MRREVTILNFLRIRAQKSQDRLVHEIKTNKIPIKDQSIEEGKIYDSDLIDLLTSLRDNTEFFDSCSVSISKVLSERAIFLEDPSYKKQAFKISMYQIINASSIEELKRLYLFHQMLFKKIETGKTEIKLDGGVKMNETHNI